MRTPLAALGRARTALPTSASLRTTTSIPPRRNLASMAPALVDGSAVPPLAASMAAAPAPAPLKSAAVPKASNVLHRHLGIMPLRAVRAEGCYIYGDDGKQYLDACGGAAVVSIGHGDQRVISALVEQISTVNYCHSGSWSTDCSEELAEMLCADANARGGDYAKVYFALGGSEAVESAIKLARQHFVEKGEAQRSNFIGRAQGFNGNSLGCLALGGHKGRRAHYEPLLSDAFHKVSPCFAYRYMREGESEAQYVQRLEEELEAKFQELGPETVAAFCAETVVGATTGCVPAVPGYFQAMKRVCDRHGALLIMDEVMSGMGRTGTLHAWEQEGVTPDIFTVAKGISGGYAPLSAVFAARNVIEPLERGSKVFVSGYTFQSYSCATRAGLEVQKIVREDKLVERCAEMGVFLEAELRRCLGSHPHVGDIRGRGLFWAVELVKDRSTKEPFSPKLGLSSKIVDDAIQKGVVLYVGSGTADGVAGDHVLISPPYTVSREQITQIAETLTAAIQDVLAQTQI